MVSEIEEAENLLATAVFPGVKGVLQNYILKLRKEEEAKKLAEEKAKATDPSQTTSAYQSVKSKPVIGGAYVPIETYSWDQGEYNSPLITIYIELEGVGTVKDSVSVEFTKASFDVTVKDLNGKNYRLLKDNLEKDIIPGQSKYVVKKDKIVLKLQKVKGEYSYEHWSGLTAKKKREEEEKSKKDPTAGIMDMMKQMYDEGDENMKKVIGEAMLKSRNGEKAAPVDM